MRVFDNSNIMMVNCFLFIFFVWVRCIFLCVFIFEEFCVFILRCKDVLVNLCNDFNSINENDISNIVIRVEWRCRFILKKVCIEILVDCSKINLLKYIYVV